MSDALLVTVVHVKMKLGDNALNNERLSLVITKLPIKKVTSCSHYFTALQCINRELKQRTFFHDGGLHSVRGMDRERRLWRENF